MRLMDHIEIQAGGPGSGPRPGEGRNPEQGYTGQPGDSSAPSHVFKPVTQPAGAIRDPRGFTYTRVDPSKTPAKVAEVIKRASTPGAKPDFGAASKSCPKCGSKKFKLMPTDYETAKCSNCGKNFNVGA